MIRKLIRTDATGWVILIRILVGGVFLSEGIQKFIRADAVGSGRFSKIGIAYPEFTAPFVGVVEMLCGVLVLIGLMTRGAVIPLLVIMVVAIATTKVPQYQSDGFWAMAHGSRTDWSMVLGSLFLLAVGGGKWSVDAKL